MNKTDSLGKNFYAFANVLGKSLFCDFDQSFYGRVLFEFDSYTKSVNHALDVELFYIK